MTRVSGAKPIGGAVVGEGRARGRGGCGAVGREAVEPSMVGDPPYLDYAKKLGRWRGGGEGGGGAVGLIPI